MSQHDDALYRVSADFKNIEDAKRFKRQIENMQNASPLMPLTGALTQDAITYLASSLARVERTLSREPIAHDSRDLMIDDLIQRVDRQARRIDSLELDIAALRSTQQPTDPAGAHPYRSATQRSTAAPSSPVATSEAAPTSSSASGCWRRVYGALVSKDSDALCLLPPVPAAAAWVALCMQGHVFLGCVVLLAVGVGGPLAITRWQVGP